MSFDLDIIRKGIYIGQYFTITHLNKFLFNVYHFRLCYITHLKILVFSVSSVIYDMLLILKMHWTVDENIIATIKMQDNFVTL